MNQPVILVCFDGTHMKWGQKNPTVVSKLQDAGNWADLEGYTVYPLYYPGVGTSFPWVLGALIGLGSAQIVAEAAQDIVMLRRQLYREYRKFPIIVITGYSRGAYYASILADFLCTVGFYMPAYRVLQRYHEYRKAKSWQPPIARPEGSPPMIHGLVALDRVGRLGVPWKAGAFFGPRFKDLKLNPWVDNALHILSRDRRVAFEPAIWDEREGITQVAIKGTHGDVGGGGERGEGTYVEDAVFEHVRTWIRWLIRGATKENQEEVVDDLVRSLHLLPDAKTIEPATGITTWAGKRDRVFPPHVKIL